MKHLIRIFTLSLFLAPGFLSSAAAQSVTKTITPNGGVVTTTSRGGRVYQSPTGGVAVRTPSGRVGVRDRYGVVTTSTTTTTTRYSNAGVVTARTPYRGVAVAPNGNAVAYGPNGVAVRRNGTTRVRYR